MATQGPIQVDAQSFKMTIVAMGSTRVAMDKAAEAAVKAAGAVLLNAVRENASRTDHSMSDLARLDHPYARRHGSIQAGRLGPAFAKRPYMVHTRSGAFLSAIQGRFTRSPISYEVQAVNRVPWVQYVIQGTRVMLPRDVIWGTALEPATKAKMQKAVIHILGKALRTQAVVRFGG